MLRAAEGFTIIELTIFLAISGLLLMLMFVGTGSIAARQRFTDTTDGLQTFFQAQYDEVVNGVNVRIDSTACTADSATITRAGKSSCLLLGKVLTIRPVDMTSTSKTVIEASYIVSTRQSTTYGATLQEKLQNAVPNVVADGQKVYEFKWGAVSSEASRTQADGTRTAVNSVAFVRLPDSDEIVQLYYNNTRDYFSASGLTQGLTELGITNLDNYSPAGTDDNPSLVVCMKNDTDFSGLVRPRSAISFGQGKGAGTITTNYQPGELCKL